MDRENFVQYIYPGTTSTIQNDKVGHQTVLRDTIVLYAE